MSLHLCAIDHKNVDGKWKVTYQQGKKSFIHNHCPAYSAVGLATHGTQGQTTA